MIDSPSPDFRLPRRRTGGSTLVMAVFVMALLATLIGLAFDFTGHTAIGARRSSDLSVAQSLANGALEAAYKRWQVYMAAKQASVITSYTTSAKFQAFTSTIQTQINTAAANTGFTLTELTIVPVDRADNELPNQSTASASVGPMPDVPGWTATTYSYRARARVAKTADSSFNVSVSRYFQQADASLFQAMLFFQNDLELHPGPNMTLYGPVHTNANMYAVAGSGGNLTFQSNVSYHGNIDTLAPASTHPSNFVNNGIGYVEGITQALYNQESGNWSSFKNPVYATSSNSQLSNVKSLDPLGTSDTTVIDATNGNASGTHEIIERPVPVSATNPAPNTSVSDPDAFAAHRVYNSAGLRILINRNAATNGGQPVRVYQPSTANPEDSVEIVPGSTPATQNVANQIIAAVTPGESIYDFREAGAVVNGVAKNGTISLDTVDVSKLTPALNAYADYNGVVYVTDITHADANGNTGDSDAVRLKKGGVLPDNGMTVVSDGAVYVQGDFNTGTTYGPDGTGGVITTTAQPVSNQNSDPTKYTVSGYTEKPAAVMGDAVMVLSNAWLDSTSSAQISARTAVPTTMNAAIVSGQVITTATAASGGAHNFPRFLENWGGDNFTYHGSMCELYASKHFIGTYGKANVYSPPNRRWFFEDAYLQTPPPGNLRSTTFGRGRWMRNTNL